VESRKVPKCEFAGKGSGDFQDKWDRFLPHSLKKRKVKSRETINGEHRTIDVNYVVSWP
jgi:hypothetical protein